MIEKARGQPAPAGVNFEMRAGAWSMGLFAAALIALPPPIPLPSPSLPISPSLAPSVAVSPGLPVATPSLPLGSTPAASAPAAPTKAANGANGSSTTQTSQSAPAGAGGHGGGVAIPFTAIYVSSPLDIAMLAALAALPLLFGIWLLVFGRTLTEARRRRDAQVRLMLAADLGLRPREVTTMSTRALFDLREKSAFDELTGVLRRAAGMSMAEREIARARRHDTPLTVAFIDVDGLKEANDGDGHAAGDAMLRDLAAALREGLRAEDAVLRYGGDEFVCVLPDTTARDARAKLSAIQDVVAARGVRFCAGLAQLRRGDDVVSLLARADGDLYDFKANRGEIVPLPAPSRQAEGENTVTA
jgi:diguanylate cyclase (GGDEF)-like protein